MAEQGLTLEEYHLFLRQFSFGDNPLIYRKNGRRIEISYLSAESDLERVFADERSIPRTLSGNNADGYILTAWPDGRA